MNEKKIAVIFLCLSVSLLVFAGCDRSGKERDEAVAEAQQTKAELARVETTLKQTQNERDELKETIARYSEEAEKAKSDLKTAIQTYSEVGNKFNELTGQRDSAIAQLKEASAQSETLSRQLKVQAKAISDYEVLVKELQRTIEDLENKIKELSEQPKEPLNMERTDGNNV